MELGVVEMKAGKERKIRNFYPWVQRGECRADGVKDGDLAKLVDHEGGFLAIGTYNSLSRFQFRVLSTTDVPIDEAFFKSRFDACTELRDRLLPGVTARRLVYSEADEVPGLIVDQYGGHFVLQVRSLGMEKLKPVWLPALIESAKPLGILERSEMAGREEEGLGGRTELLYGTVPDETEINENGLRLRVPLKEGLKTGHYLDQRETRRRLSERVKPGEKLLDCFCYTGSMALAAVQKGATAYGVDIHDHAIEIARSNAATNGLETVFVKANVFEYLDQDAMGPYDWIVLDPPALAKTAEKRDSLKWAVWKLAHKAMPLLKPGGRVIVCSCSYQLGLHELIETVRLAASDRHCRLILEDVTFQDVDHPAPVQFPESMYLKCAWLRKG